MTHQSKKILRHFFGLSFLLMTTFSSTASDIHFYLGTYTHNTGSRGIYQGTLNTETGKLGPVTLAAEAKSPSYLALSPDEKFLYAVSEEGAGALDAFRVQTDGTLTFLNEQPSGGAAPCFVSVDPTGRNVLLANYTGGSVANFRIGTDGALAERTAFVEFTGSGPNLKRQAKPHAHSIYTAASNRAVLVADLGTDQLRVLAFDPDKGTLNPLDSSNGHVPPGEGPRHVVQHPDGKHFYVVNEMGLSVSLLERNPAGAFQTVATYPVLDRKPGPIDGYSSAAIKLHPNRRWLYVSVRGHDSISSYEVQTDDTLKWLGNVPAGVKTPRDFAIDPTGKWLLVGGQNDSKIVVHRIDSTNGKLLSTTESAPVSAAVCILFTNR
jgi:6-phosphogluconolactonase